MIGVMCYSSKELIPWENRGVASYVSEDRGSAIGRGCVLERLQVI